VVHDPLDGGGGGVFTGRGYSALDQTVASSSGPAQHRPPKVESSGGIIRRAGHQRAVHEVMIYTHSSGWERLEGKTPSRRARLPGG